MNANECMEMLTKAPTPNGPWADLRTVKDLAGLPRVSIARRP
jgi:hypothetical protein